MINSLTPIIHPDSVHDAAHDSAPGQARHLLHTRSYPAAISLVIPMYNEEQVIRLLRTEVTSYIDSLPAEVEVVLVNDGSTDRTLIHAAAWARDDRRVKVLQLARNFGHQAAATAGLDYATGDVVVLMDADLQDPVSVIDTMIARYCEGYDVVYGQRARRAGKTPLKRLTAWLFYRMMRQFVYRQLPVDSGDFRLMSRGCLNALQQMRETHRFLRGMVTWIGFPQCAVVYERHPRVAGTTKYPLSKMLKFAWTAATSFSTLPLKLSLYLGVGVGLTGLFQAFRALFAHFFGFVVPGWTSLMIVTCLIGSAMLMCLAILGQYVGMIYEQSKGRPIYLVAHTLGSNARASAAPVWEMNAQLGIPFTHAVRSSSDAA